MLTWWIVFVHYLWIGFIVNIVDLCNFDQISILDLNSQY